LIALHPPSTVSSITTIYIFTPRAPENPHIVSNPLLRQTVGYKQYLQYKYTKKEKAKEVYERKGIGDTSTCISAEGADAADGHRFEASAVSGEHSQ